MSIDIASFRTRFPEFADDTAYPDPRVQLALDDAELCVDETKFGTLYELGVMHLAAHELKLTTDIANSPASAGAIGPVSSKTAGGVSVTKAINNIDLSDGDAYYQQAQYGLKFLNIRDKVKIPAFMVITAC